MSAANGSRPFGVSAPCRAEHRRGRNFTITVRGRAVATLGPAVGNERRRVNLPAEPLLTLLADTPVDDDLAAEIAGLREPEDSWPGQ